VPLDEIRRLIADEEAFERGPGVETRRTSWQFNTTGDEATQERLRELMLAYRSHFADATRFKKLDEWHKGGAAADDQLLARQVEDLWLRYLAAQEDAATREESVRLTAEQQGLFNRFRAQLDGREWSENELNDELATTTDAARAQRIWEAAKQIGQQAEARALRLVDLRNQAARGQGFRDAYERGLALAEVDEATLLRLLEELERRSDKPYRAAKAKLDEELAARFGIGVDELRPWHYGDPFFQRPPRAAGPDLDPYFQEKTPEDLATAACDSIHLDPRAILGRSDLYPRPGKNQHAFCTTIQPDGSDVRILCNNTRSHRWTATTLHELGHALAAEYADRSLPQSLVLWPNSIIAETESQTIERMASDARWLAEAVGVPDTKAEELAAAMRERDRLAQLVMTRWSLVMAHFERALFKDPTADLRTLWWDLVERFQLIHRPDGRHEPDWAAKIHLANFPGNYYAYIIAELAVSQLHNALVTEVGGLYGHSEAGTYLRDRLYRHGSRYRWDRTVELATGQPIGVDAYAGEWFE
jgi:peptidyl-dipeptidase A